MNAEPQGTVYIVEDDEAFRKSLISLLETVRLRTEPFASADEFLETFAEDGAGCILLDVRMPGISGLDLLEQLRGQGSEMPIILLSGYGDISMAVRAMKSGATDFLAKPFDEQELIDRVQRAIRYDIERRQHRQSARDILARVEELTPREREVLCEIVQGHSSREIAGKLHISHKTVEVHRIRIMRKMKAKNVAQLVNMVNAHQNLLKGRVL